MPITVQDLATRIGGKVEGDANIQLTGIAPIPQARATEITFAENPKHCSAAEGCAAVAVIVPLNAPTSKKTLIRVKNPRAAFARTLAIFCPPRSYPAQIHPTAQLGRNVRLGEGVFIGEYAVLRDNVTIGNRTVIETHCVIGEGSVLGDDCLLYPKVTLYHDIRIGNRVGIHAGSVIGSDGFGYVQDGAERLKIPQVGNVIIEDDVEIGANVAIDRATMNSTIIRRWTKIDNLVQIAHNVTLGQNCLIVSQAGVAGSVEIGDNVTLAGQVGVADHLKVGANSVVGAQSGVAWDLPPDSIVWGTPAQPIMQTKRQMAALRKLPELLRKIGK
jgi:UDP-3-O-[3-hydroxymyristoyl] glucosamine N-acyltransferase